LILVFNTFFTVAEIVERVVLLGAPISINNENWRDVRKVINLLDEISLTLTIVGATV